MIFINSFVTSEYLIMMKHETRNTHYTTEMIKQITFNLLNSLK